MYRGVVCGRSSGTLVGLGCFAGEGGGKQMTQKMHCQFGARQSRVESLCFRTITRQKASRAVA